MTWTLTDTQHWALKGLGLTIWRRRGVDVKWLRRSPEADVTLLVPDGVELPKPTFLQDVVVAVGGHDYSIAVSGNQMDSVRIILPQREIEVDVERFCRGGRPLWQDLVDV
ncbi:MAG: hypothetical protein D6694_02205 [Gammaproteobacteria bacterium]|nr:MAG: hypothetical protein D6694_02205 [Gammaproteobacteria bacterium]